VDESEARQVLTSVGSRYVRRHRFDNQSLISVVVDRAAWFERCTFVGAALRLATLDGVHFKMCDFRGAQMRGASLRGVWFAGCDLRDTDLRDADLTGAHFGYVNTGKDDIGRTDLTGATLAGADTDRVTFEQVMGWPSGD
jgi:uncharacterized protein YjbI with pentapeptide repeats